MSEIDLTPPRFLDSRFRDPPLQARAATTGWVMPPLGLGPVFRSVKRGNDTSQKLTRSLPKMPPEAIRKCLVSLLSTGSIYQDGRRYRANK